MKSVQQQVLLNNMIKEIRTFLNIQNAILSRAKLEDKESVRDIVKEKINTAYQLISIEKPYRWSGVTYPLRLRGKYTTGTVTMTNNSDQVTGAATVWTQNAHQGLKFFVSGVNVAYKILAVLSETSIVLDAPWTGTTGAALTYTIFKDEYGMYPDMQDIRKLWIPGLANQLNPTPCGPDEIDNYRARSPFQTGTPKFYTLNGKNIYTEKTWATFNLNTDFWEDNYDDAPRNENLIVWPGLLTADRIAKVRYTMIVPQLARDEDEPLMALGHRIRIVYDVLIDHFITNRDAATKREWKIQRDEVKKMMAADIETIDDELILYVDRSRYSRPSRYAGWDYPNEEL